MSNLIALLDCGNYRYGKFDEVNNLTYAKEFTNFPYTDVSNLETIKSFGIPNLGYTVEGSHMNIFDKTKEEYITYTLPIFVKYFDQIKPTKNTTKVTFPTTESYKAACNMYSIIQREYTKLRLKEEREEIYSVINKGNGIAYLKYSDFPNLTDILYHDDTIHIFYSYYYNHYVIGTKATAKELTLKVPQSIVGKVIGKGGKNVKEMAKCLGASYIKVIPM